MMRLVLSELKKIFKNKFNIFVIVVMIIGFSLNGYNTLEHVLINPSANSYPKDFKLETFDGKILNSSKEVYVYVDEVLSKYEGNPTKEKWEQFKKDYNTLVKEYIFEYDETWMENLYGKDWESLLERNFAGKLTDQDIEYLTSLYDKGKIPTSSGYFEEENQFDMPILHKEESKLATLNYIYKRMYRNNSYIDYYIDDQKIVDQGNELNYPLYLYTHPEVYKKEMIERYSIMYGNEFKETNFKIWLDENFDNFKFTFDSNMSMTLLFTAYNQNSFILLIVIAIVCANTFSQEKSSKMDQLITPTYTGETKIVLAKFLANLTISLGMLVSLIIILTGISCSFMGIDGLSNNVFAFDSGGQIPYLTYAKYLLITYQMWIIAVIGICSLVSFLSYYTKNRFITIILLAGFIIAPIAFSGLLPNWLAAILPSVFYDIEYMILPNHIVTDLMVEDGIWFKDVASILWILLTLLFLGLILLKAKRHYVENK